MSQIKLLQCIADKLCELVDLQSTPQVRRDVEILCDVTNPLAPVPVIVRYEYSPDGVSQTVAAYNLDLTAYAGAVTALRACETDQVRYDVEFKDFCVNGASRIRITVFDAEVNSATPVTTAWTDLLGNVVAAPGIGDTITLGACVDAVNYPYSYEACVTIAGQETPVRVFELRSSTGAVINRRIELSDGTDVTLTSTLVECGTCCDSNLLPLNMRCDSYIKTSSGLPNIGGWLSGENQWPAKWSNVTDYDNLAIDVGAPAGAPRSLRYVVSGEINGNPISGTVTINVPDATQPAALATSFNSIVGANIFSVDSTGWSFAYNTAWTSMHIAIQEYMDDHAGGYILANPGAWGIRLNAGVLEDGIGVDPLDLDIGNYIPAGNCVSI